MRNAPADGPQSFVRRHRALFAAVAAMVLLGAGAIVLALLWSRSGAHEASVSDARKRFAASTSTQPQRSTNLVPRAGVYVYTGSGTEHLSKPPKTQKQGPHLPGTVTHDADGCWTFRIDYNSAHWQSWNYCARDGSLLELGGQTFERWDFVFMKVDSTAHFTCDPPSVDIRPSMSPGDTWSQSCVGTASGTNGSSTTAGPYTFIGDDSVVVAGTSVPAYHFREERTLTGTQKGTQRYDVWFAQRDGLPLRNDRTITVNTDSIIGTVTYTERGSFTLASLDPQV